MIVLAIVVIAVIVFFERAQRRLLIQYPKRQVGNRMFQGETSHLPLKLNTAGRHPADLRPRRCLLLPATVAGFSNSGDAAGLGAARCSAALGHGQPLYMFALRRMIVVLRFLLYGDRLQSEGHRRPAEEALRPSFRATARASARPNTSTTCSPGITAGRRDLPRRHLLLIPSS